MIKGAFEVEIEFAAGGNSMPFKMNGWSRPEPRYTFNQGHTARLVLPKPFDADQYQISMDVWPCVVPDRVPVQHIKVIVRGNSGTECGGQHT